MNRPALEADAPQHRPTPEAKLVSLPELPELWRAAVERATAKDLAVESEDVSIAAITELRRVLDERVQHWLKIECRAVDDLEDLRRGSLLIQRLGQVLVTRLQLGEQPDVLDGDDGLVGESFQQLDMVVREQARLGAPHRDRTGYHALPQHWDGKNTSSARR